MQAARSDAIENRPERTVGIAHLFAAVAACDERFAGNRSGELRDQPRLTDAGVAFDRHEPRAGVARERKRFAHEGQLVVAADEPIAC